MWRTIRIREDLPLTQVHDRIQGAMGWNDSHLHLFKIGGIEYADHELWEDPVDMADERIMTLKNAKLKVGDSFSYLYDMGDDWQNIRSLWRSAQRSTQNMPNRGSWTAPMPVHQRT